MYARHVLSRFSMLTAAALMAGCLSDGGKDGGGGKVMVKAELIKSKTGASALTKKSAAAVGAPHWTSDARILSYRIPIRRMMVHNADGSMNSGIYECTGSLDSCTVELNGPALEDLLGAAPVNVNQGTYDNVDILTCFTPDTGYTAWVTAEVTLDGVTRYTHPTEVLSTTGPAQPLGINYTGCGRTYNLPTPLVVTDSAGALIPFRLFFDIQDLVWASLGESETSRAWAPGNCTGPGPHPGSAGVGMPYVCAGYPDVVGTTDVVEPKLERYYLNGGGIIGVYTSGSNDRFIGGYSRRFLKEGAPDSTGFEAVTPVKTFEANGDGTYTLELWGGYPDLTIPYFRAPQFRREAHSGPYTAARAPGGTYQAVTVRP